MKSAKLLVALAATGLIATSAFAQKSAFEGFYGQIATGYESNTASNLGNVTSDAGNAPNNWNVSNQTFGGAPLVIGLGYNFSVAPKWVVGLGADYSAISQKSSSFSGTNPGGTLTGQTLETSNRFNIFVTPGYEIDKDKLVYLKAGYSSLNLKNSAPNYYSASAAAIANEGENNSGAIASSSPTTTVSGYIVGLGYKQIITGGVYGFAEGNYMSYSKANFSTVIGQVTTITSNPSVNSYQLLVGVGYKF